MSTTKTAKVALEKGRVLIIEGDKTFKITIPETAKVTFGPWSPTTKKGNPDWDRGESRGGTLRIYSTEGEKSILACFSGVRSFRETSIDYTERVAVEEGAAIWKSDENGYQREDKISKKQQWKAIPSA